MELVRAVLRELEMRSRHLDSDLVIVSLLVRPPAAAASLPVVKLYRFLRYHSLIPIGFFLYI